MLEDVLAFEELAGGVIPSTNSTGIQSCLRAQHLVTTYRLQDGRNRRNLDNTEGILGPTSHSVDLDVVNELLYIMFLKSALYLTDSFDAQVPSVV